VAGLRILFAASPLRCAVRPDDVLIVGGVFTDPLPMQLPPSLPGFEHIGRTFDRREGVVVARIQPGEYYVTRGSDLISTVLGSCVSACIRDPLTGVGGMNHFMLPGPHPNARYGGFAMERLIEALVHQGARKQHLEIKIVGGSQMWSSKVEIGERNIAFALQYAASGGMQVRAQDVGGSSARLVHYEPRSGRLWIRKLRPTRTGWHELASPSAKTQ
jgi:chemotaxis protein CheD